MFWKSNRNSFCSAWLFDVAPVLSNTKSVFSSCSSFTPGYETRDAHAELDGNDFTWLLRLSKIEEVIKSQFNEDLFIEDETDIFIFLAIKQTWIIQILLNLERRRYIPRLKGFSENIVPQFDSKQFLRHFRLSSEMFDLIMNSIVHSLTDDNAWPGDTEAL